MNALTWIAEQKILEAVMSGELDNLPGAGRPLDLNDDWGGCSANRLAYKILKNAGYLPLTLLLRKEVEGLAQEAESLLQSCRERTAPFLTRSSLSEEQLDSYWHVVQTFRERYHEQIQRINQKITELRHACIREEIMSGLRYAAALELPLLNADALLKKFDAEFTLERAEPQPHFEV